MREQEAKLANVKKSCEVARKVTKVFSILMIIATVMCLIGGITVFAARNYINDNVVIDDYKSDGIIRFRIADGTTDEFSGYITMDDISSAGLIGVNFNLDRAISEGKIAQILMGECFGGFLICLIATAIFIMIQKTFVLIKDSETPFDPAVLKRLKLVFVIITIAALLFSGVGTAVMSGIVFWCVYCILDYGFILQQEVDETL